MNLLQKNFVGVLCTMLLYFPDQCFVSTSLLCFWYAAIYKDLNKPIMGLDRTDQLIALTILSFILIVYFQVWAIILASGVLSLAITAVYKRFFNE